MGMLSTSGAYAESQSHHVGRRRVRRCAFSSVPLAHPVVGQFQRVRSSARRLWVKRTPWPGWPVSRQQPRVPAHHAHPPGWTRAGAGAQSRRVAVGPEWPSRRYQTAQLSWVGMRWSPEAVAGHKGAVDDGVYIVDNPRIFKVTFSCKRVRRCQTRPASVARNFGSAHCPTATIGLLRCQPLPATYSPVTYWRSGCFSSRPFTERSTILGRLKLSMR